MLSVRGGLQTENNDILVPKCNQKKLYFPRTASVQDLCLSVNAPYSKEN